MSALIRYNIIREKFPREIVLLRGSGCHYKKCIFCDYHLDASQKQEENIHLNHQVLQNVSGCTRRLEVINSGSFTELPLQTIQEIKEICLEKGIREVSFESHWMYRKKIAPFRDFFARDGISLILKIGVETFDIPYREQILKKGMGLAAPEEIAEYFDAVCLLFGLKGQTVERMKADIDTGLRCFSRICINLMTENTTAVKPDGAVIEQFMKTLYPLYRDHQRVDILSVNTDFGVGGIEP